MDVFGRTGLTPSQWNAGKHGKGLAYDQKIAFRKAGGRNIVLTGDKELDAKLKLMPAKLSKKLSNKALRKSGVRVLAAFKAIVRNEAHDTGAYERAASIKKLTKIKDKQGVRIHIDKDKLLAIREKKKGRVGGLTKQGDIIKANKPKFDEMFYYPASLEFGYKLRDGSHKEGVRAQRRALYDNQAAVKAAFLSDLREFVAEAGL